MSYQLEVNNKLQELTEKVKAMDYRKEELKTKEGKTKAKKELIELMMILQAAGYKPPDCNGAVLANVWLKVLEEYLVMYGYEIIPASAWEFISNDDRDVKTFPKPSDYIKAIKQIGGLNPKVELARLKAKMVEDEIEREHREEYAKLWDAIPEDKKAEMLKGVDYASYWKD